MPPLVERLIEKKALGEKTGRGFYERRKGASGESEIWTGSLTLGIVLGLVIGKQVGITAFAWLAVRLRLAELPHDVDWREVWATAWLGGIGFTMSLFIANLAFPDAALLASSKLAILTASILSALGGWWILSRVAGTRRHPAP